MTQTELILDKLGEIKEDIAVLKEKQAEQSRVREVLSKWLLWAAGIIVLLGSGGITGVTNNHLKNNDQDHDISDIRKFLKMKP